MAKKKNEPVGGNLANVAKDVEQMAKEMGIETINIHATKITIQTAEGKNIILDPISCTASVMKGYEEYGINFQITAKVKKGSLK